LINYTIVENKYKIGHVVHHKNYDYYGVIFHADESCKAADDWYKRNRTQPDRDQPWYNVLVDGGSETYVAEENLEFDLTGKKITHPVLDQMFFSYHNGRYFKVSMN